jgi:hypothetical protein
MDHDAIVWISGSNRRLGSGLAATVPFENARIINLSLYEDPTI